MVSAVFIIVIIDIHLKSLEVCRAADNFYDPFFCLIFINFLKMFFFYKEIIFRAYVFSLTIVRNDFFSLPFCKLLKAYYKWYFLSHFFFSFCCHERAGVSFDAGHRTQRSVVWHLKSGSLHTKIFFFKGENLFIFLIKGKVYSTIILLTYLCNAYNSCEHFFP